MPDKPQVSIVLPVHNGAKYLRAAIDSALNQTHQDLELIIIDDASDDATQAIIADYQDPRLKAVHHKERRPKASLLNEGFKLAQGRWLTFTSYDHQYLPTAIEEMLKFLQEHTDIDFVYADMVAVHLESGERTLRKCSHATFYFENILGGCFLFSRKLFEQVGEFDPRFDLVEDYDYWLRVEKRFSMRHLNKVLYLYGDHHESLANSEFPFIEVLAALLRFRHGYANFEVLTASVGVCVAQFLPFQAYSRKKFRQLLKRISTLDLKLQAAFWASCGMSLFKKSNTAVKLVTKKLLSKERPFTDVLSGLKKSGSGNIQVLCVIPYLTMGGSEKVMQDIVAGLGSQGYDFHLLGFKQDENPWVKKFLGSFLNAVDLPYLSDVDAYARRVISIVEKLGIDMVLVTNAHIFYKALPKIKEALPDLKVIDIIHLEHVGGTFKPLSAVGAPHLDRRVCISRHLLEYMKTNYESEGTSHLADRLRVVHNGTHLSDFVHDAKDGKFRKRFGVPEHTKIISFAARITPEKNPFIFMDIGRRIISRNPSLDVRFVMAGSGPLLSGLKARIKDYGLEKYFILPGLLTNISEMLRDSFLFVLVSTHEGIPLAIQEALLMKVPVISTRVGAIHEIIHEGGNGFLVALDEQVVEKAADKIEYLLSDPEAYQAMVEKTRESVYPEFTLEVMCRRYQEIFAEVFASKEAPALDILEVPYA